MLADCGGRERFNYNDIKKRVSQVKYGVKSQSLFRLHVHCAQLHSLAETRVSSKQTKIIFGSNRKTNRNKICFAFAFVSVCFVKPITKIFGLFWCFEPISKQPKQTELFHNKPKHTETTLNFLKNTQIYSLLNCLGGSSVCFGSIETLCFVIEAKQPKHRNKLFRNKPKKPKKNEKT